MGFRRKSFDKENKHTSTEKVFKKKKRKKKVDRPVDPLKTTEEFEL